MFCCGSDCVSSDGLLTASHLCLQGVHNHQAVQLPRQTGDPDRAGGGSREELKVLREREFSLKYFHKTVTRFCSGQTINSSQTSLIHRLHWFTDFTDSQTSPIHRLHLFTDFTYSQTSPIHRLHRFKDFTDSLIVPRPSLSPYHCTSSLPAERDFFCTKKLIGKEMKN